MSGKKMRSLSHQGKSETIKLILWSVSVFAMLVLILFPLFLLFKYSISDHASLVTSGRPVPLWPNHPTFSVFVWLFGSRQFWFVVGNSLFIALSTVLLSMILGVPAGYVIARHEIPFKKAFLILLVSVRLFPDIASVIPVTTFFIKLNLHSTYVSIILTHALLSLPYVIFISSAAFEFVPRDLEEQARVMGAGPVRIFLQILVPVIFPSLIAAAIYTFLLSWDEFIFANFLLNTGGKLQTLTLYLNQNLSQKPAQNILAAISVCLSLPVIIFTFIVQRYMVSGISAGAVK